MAEVMLEKDDKKELDELMEFLKEIGQVKRKELKGFILGAQFAMNTRGIKSERESKSVQVKQPVQVERRKNCGKYREVMNNLIHIGNVDISIKEYKGQRVVTFKDIDMVHERPEGTARRNFNTNLRRDLMKL